MITREQALERAEQWINGDRGERAEVGIHEFDLGYVVWEVEQPPEDLSQPPAVIGSSRGVIDKESGELSIWPSAPVQSVADNYRRERSGEAPHWGES